MTKENLNKNKSRVAIITRTKDRHILLKRALYSLQQQTFKEFIWVVVNDGGEKKYVNQIVEDGRKSGIIINLIHNKQSLGMEAASNCGIRSVDSEFIVIHDDDDSWDPEFLQKTVEFLDKKEIYGGVVSLSTQVNEEINGENVEIKEFKPFNPHLKNIYLTEMACTNLFPPISFIYRRSVTNEIGFYNSNLPVLGDWEFNLRFLEKFDIGVIYEPLAFYHHRPNVDGIYGNTIYSGISKHIEYDSLVRNSLVRKDLKSGQLGLGYLVAIGSNSSHLYGNITGMFQFLTKLRNIANKLGIIWLINKLSK